MHTLIVAYVDHQMNLQNILQLHLFQTLPITYCIYPQLIQKLWLCILLVWSIHITWNIWDVLCFELFRNVCTLNYKTTTECSLRSLPWQVTLTSTQSHCNIVSAIAVIIILLPVIFHWTLRHKNNYTTTIVTNGTGYWLHCCLNAHLHRIPQTWVEWHIKYENIY